MTLISGIRVFVVNGVSLSETFRIRRRSDVARIDVLQTLNEPDCFPAAEADFSLNDAKSTRFYEKPRRALFAGDAARRLYPLICLSLISIF